MVFLRLGVQCAVFDDDGRVLLSRRGDLNIWDLPGGRLDPHERLEEAAAREVREETGIIAHIERPIGLYYWAGWSRLNVLYAAWPLGGTLRSATDEARANAYFDLNALPADLSWEWMLFDAVSEVRPPPRIVETPAVERRRIRQRLRRRWFRNWLAGRPEPRFPRFDVRAVGVVWDEAHRQVLTVSSVRSRALPRVVCTGRASPWDELGQMVRRHCGLSPEWCWVGLWQQPAQNRLELVFAATIEEAELAAGAEWLTARNAALSGLDVEYVERVKPAYADAPVWSLVDASTLEPDLTESVT